MKRQTLLMLGAMLGTLGSLLASPACATPAQTASIEHAAHDAYVAAINSNDLDRFLSRLTEDAVFQMPGTPEIAGKKAVRDWAAAYLAACQTHWDKASQNFTVDGEWAFERYTYASADTDRQTGMVTRDTGKGITIFRRGRDGQWRVAVDGWSSDKSPTP